MPLIPRANSVHGQGRLFEQAKDFVYGDFRDDVIRDGFAVVKNAVPRERADAYADAMYTWLEHFGLGFDRNDPSTVHERHLPIINEKGMCSGYGLPHEKFAWDIRSEPGVVNAFEKIYDTEDLLVSFDAVNLTFPGRADIKPNKPWPHQDQDPLKPGFRCMQGLVNLLPNGPDDGGLIVCKGAHLFSEQFHKEFADEPDKVWAWTTEWYGFTDRGMKWLEDKGLKWEKISAEPGDLLIWDSRLPHFNLSPTGTQPRFCAYTCYMPVADATLEDLKRKKEVFEQCQATSHWPNAVHVTSTGPLFRNGVEDPYNFKYPKSGVPELSERGFRLTGIPYIAATSA